MPTKKATSSRTPAAARKSAPELSRRTAAKAQQPRESRGPSPTVVRKPVKTLRGLAALNQRPDVPFHSPIQSLSCTQVRAALETGLHPRFDQKDPDIRHLMGLLASIPAFCDDERGVFLADMRDCRSADAKEHRVLRLAARILRVGYFLGALDTLARRKGGAL